MEGILEYIKTDTFMITIFFGIILLIVLYFVNIILLCKMKSNYKKFMNKIGNGNNIQETIENYMKKVNEIKNDNENIREYCKELDNTIAKSIQKIGLIRYSAFKDTGSNLSFTLALLNEENTGIVLNGIYSREMSNIYAKPVEKGVSTYTLSEEERQAIDKAMNN